VWKATKHSSMNSKGASLANRYVRGLAIHEKSLVKRL
jgi:hypothetical protein